MIDKKSSHPKATWVLLLVHSFERFGFWGMRGLLLLYMIEPTINGGLGWSDSKAIAFKGMYAGLSYFMPVIGGKIADEYMGAFKSIVLGNLSIALGILLLAVGKTNFFYMGLGLVSLGNGFFKPCLTSMLGKFYSKDNPLRDKAYHYLFQSVLIGVLCASIASGSFMVIYGFETAFMLIAVVPALGMIIFAVYFRKGWKYVDIDDKPKKTSTCDNLDRRNLWQILVTALFAVIFFAAYSQGSGLLTVYAHKFTERHVMGYEIPTTWIACIGTIYAIILTPLVGHLWSKMAGDGREPHFSLKISMGLCSTAIAFIIMIAAVAQGSNSASGLSSIYWFFLFDFFYALGRLVVPTLWSTVQRLAPEKYRFFSMGIILGSISLGSILGGQIGALISNHSISFIFMILMSMCFISALIFPIIFKRIFLNKIEAPKSSES